MKPLFIGLCALVTPLVYDNLYRKEKTIKLNVFQKIFGKYQLVDEQTDLNTVSEDYPVILYRPLKLGEGSIKDDELGLEFKDVCALTRTVEVKVDLNNNGSNQEFIKVPDTQLKNLTNGKFSKCYLELVAKKLHFDDIKLNDNFFPEFFREYAYTVDNANLFVTNQKKETGEFVLNLPVNDSNNDALNINYLGNKFIDISHNTNDVFIKANKDHLSKHDLRIRYAAYKPLEEFIVICVKDKPNRLIEESRKGGLISDYINSYSETEKLNPNEARLRPAFRYGAWDYMILPFQVRDKTKTKEEVDKFLKDKIQEYDLIPLAKQVRKYVYYGGLFFIGYGYLCLKLKNFSFSSLKDIIFTFISAASFI